MYGNRTAAAIVVATAVMALGTAPDANASKEKFVRDKPHVAIDADAVAATETADSVAAEHDHGKAKGSDCKMHEMKAGKEGKEKGCKMKQKKQKRMQMKKQSDAEHEHDNEETTD